MKHRKKAHRRGRWASRRRKLAALAAVLIAAAALLALSPLGQQLRGLAAPGPPAPPRAAIVDQTAVYDPNPEFVAAATDTLEAAGYLVDYYPGEEVTVDLYRQLPAHGYDLVVLRVHAGRIRGGGEESGGASLFTSEPYGTTIHIQDQMAQRLTLAWYHEGADPLFSIPPQFIEDGMEGRFDDTLIIMMGCDGLRGGRTAEAFLDKGAGAFVSWDDLISWSHSDAATERLLELILIDELDTIEAVEQTAAEVGPDPVFGAHLRIVTGDG